jgi:hypothetical protein
MFISACIFVISLAAVVQFLIYSWRSGLLRVAGARNPIITAGQAASVYRKILETEDFNEVISYQKVCQDLRPSGGRGLSSVELYYGFLDSVRCFGDWIGFEGAAAWSNKEMALCTRYAAAVMVERLERNQALAAEVRSF